VILGVKLNQTQTLKGRKTLVNKISHTGDKPICTWGARARVYLQVWLHADLLLVHGEQQHAGGTDQDAHVVTQEVHNRPVVLSLQQLRQLQYERRRQYNVNVNITLNLDQRKRQ